MHRHNFQGRNLLSVGLSEGKEWLEQRRFMVKNLSDLGVGKKERMDVAIRRDAEELVQYLVKRSGMTIQSKVHSTYIVNNPAQFLLHRVFLHL